MGKANKLISKQDVKVNGITELTDNELLEIVGDGNIRVTAKTPGCPVNLDKKIEYCTYSYPDDNCCN
ncbi:MAG: hypothetical protein MJ247_04105 [Alphaproteobacteria bacterium]|nr:hypothetical protein [Alphaproteobacteria bacterium]